MLHLKVLLLLLFSTKIVAQTKSQSEKPQIDQENQKTEQQAKPDKKILDLKEKLGVLWFKQFPTSSSEENVFYKATDTTVLGHLRSTCQCTPFLFPKHDEENQKIICQELTDFAYASRNCHFNATTNLSQIQFKTSNNETNLLPISVHVLCELECGALYYKCQPAVFNIFQSCRFKDSLEQAIVRYENSAILVMTRSWALTKRKIKFLKHIVGEEIEGAELVVEKLFEKLGLIIFGLGGIWLWIYLLFYQFNT